MGEIGKSSSESSSASMSRGRARVWGEQSPYLLDLYQRGANLLQNFQPTSAVNRGARQAWNQQVNPQMNPHLDAMTSQYTQALGQLDNQTGAAAVAGGVFGGGRQGVEQALNQQNIGNQIGNFLGSQYQGDMARANQALGMAPMIQGMTSQGQKANYFGQVAGLFGSPTVLSRTKSEAKGSSDSKGLGIGAK